jgi:GNAT superfamily N-acetyltransferase
MQELASTCWPRGPHPGGLGWEQAIGQLADTIVLLESDSGGISGWAGLSQPGYLSLQVAPTQPAARAQLVEWLLATADGPELSVVVYDPDMVAEFTRAGFEQTPPSAGFYGMGTPGLQAHVDDVIGATSAGYTVRSVRRGEADERVAVHRASWRPADLPFHPDHRPHLDESWSSSFTADAYREVQATAFYDSDLDVVAVAPNGEFAGCCIGWFDPATGWAEIEPLGVVPGHRRHGLAIALCAAVARKVARAGGHHVLINTGPSTIYPAPYRAYQKAGFTPFERSTALTRH